jgi:hypothetical protein
MFFCQLFNDENSIQGEVKFIVHHPHFQEQIRAVENISLSKWVSEERYIHIRINFPSRTKVICID